MKRLPNFLLLFLLAHSLTSCALVKHWKEEIRKARKVQPLVQPAEASSPAVSTALFSYEGRNVPGPASVHIDLSEQKARIRKAGNEVGWTYVATGVAAHPTPTGSFHIMEKTADKRSNRWGVIINAAGSTIDREARAGRESIPAGGRFLGAPMPHWMRLTSYGIGMHGGPIPHPGSPASHGCIRLPYEMAGILFEELPSGTPVVITH